MSWTTPPTWTAGQTAGVSSGLQILSDDLALIGGPKGTYTPTATGITLGNGTLTGYYKQVDKMVDFDIQFTLGSTSAVTTSVTFTLPTAAVSRMVTRFFSDATAYDSSVPSAYSMTAIITSTTVVTLRVPGSPVTAVGSTVPFTWATGDIITVAGRYEAA